MSIVVAVRKRGKIVIGSDTLCTIHNTLASHADMGRPTPKIVRFNEAYIGGTGWAAVMSWLEDIAQRPAAGEELSFAGRLEVLRSFNALHAMLKDDYAMRVRESQPDEPGESIRNNFLVVSPYGIFCVAPHRSVDQYERFWAIGSGHPYALGAMEALYWREDLEAGDIAQRALRVACEFDPNCGLPLRSFQVYEWNPSDAKNPAHANVEGGAGA